MTRRGVPRTDGWGERVGPRGPIKSPLRVALEAHLADGRWHEAEALAAALAPLIDPGRASRRYWQQNRSQPFYDKVPGEEQVRRGRRCLIVDMLSNIVDAGHPVEVAGFGKTRRYRLDLRPIDDPAKLARVAAAKAARAAGLRRWRASKKEALA